MEFFFLEYGSKHGFQFIFQNDKGSILFQNSYLHILGPAMELKYPNKCVKCVLPSYQDPVFISPEHIKFGWNSTYAKFSMGFLFIQFTVKFIYFFWDSFFKLLRVDRLKKCF